jgi:DnaK suppressor protein
LEKLKNYRPSEKEPFMNERQRDYFRAKLLAWKDEILRESKLTLQALQEENVNHPDLADRASSETDRAIELRARDRQRKLIAKIDAAMQRIEDNTYGYCEETGEPISLKRLESRRLRPCRSRRRNDTRSAKSLSRRVGRARPVCRRDRIDCRRGALLQYQNDFNWCDNSGNAGSAELCRRGSALAARPHDALGFGNEHRSGYGRVGLYRGAYHPAAAGRRPRRADHCASSGQEQGCARDAAPGRRAVD